MFVGNFKSYEDEKTKRLTQKDLLQIMVDNEMEKERRVRDFRNPYAPRPVPPPYKTIAERRADAIEQEKQAVNNLETLVEFSSQEFLFVVNKIRSSDVADGLFNFNSFFPQIKNRLLRTLNPKLLTPEFLAKNIIDYLRTATSSNPLVDATDTANDYNRFRGRYALQDDYEAFLVKYRLFVNKLEETDGADDIKEGIKEIEDEIIDIKEIMVDDKYLEDLKQTITTSELDEVVKLIEKYYSEQSIPDITLLATIEKDMNKFIENSNLAVAQKVLDTLARRVYSVATTLNERKFDALIRRLEQYQEEDIAERIEVKTMTSSEPPQAGVEESKGQDFSPIVEEEETFLAEEEAKKNYDAYVNTIIADLRDLFDEEKYEELIRDVIKMLDAIEKGFKTKKFITKMNEDKTQPTLTNVITLKDEFTFYDIGNQPNEDLLALLERFYDELNNFVIIKRSVYATAYNPEAGKFSQSAYKPKNKDKKGFGVGGSSPNDKGFKGRVPLVRNKRVVLPEKMGVIHNNITRKELRQEELMTQNKLNRRGRKPSITGRGIVVEIPEDTYKTFGKHIIHYPQLRDTNVLNIKYPSKSKNFTPKMVISQEYRDLIMDILERGNYTNTLLDKLEDDEREHFHKVVKGAGLMEQFKLKPQTNNKIKELGARFKVLRGQFLAGNNAPTLISELRSIVIMFIEKGVIQKQDGYDLLKELS